MKKLTEKKFIMSVDAETDGLWGNVFAVAAIVYDAETEKEIDKICLRLPNEAIKNKWVIENVLPTLDFAVTHDVNRSMTTLSENALELQLNSRYKSMLIDFATFYMKYKNVSEILWHMGHIVESHLFREMHGFGFIGDWDAPYAPIEVATLLLSVNEDPSSVDNYVKKHNVIVSNYGTTHNPLYDCEVAAKVAFDIVKAGKLC